MSSCKTNVWQTIDNCPKNELVLVYCRHDYFGGDDGTMTVAYMDPSEVHPWHVEDGRKRPKLWVMPTHWCPLLALPEGEETKLDPAP